MEDREGDGDDEFAVIEQGSENVGRPAERRVDDQLNGRKEDGKLHKEWLGPAYLSDVSRRGLML